MKFWILCSSQLYANFERSCSARLAHGDLFLGSLALTDLNALVLLVRINRETEIVSRISHLARVDTAIFCFSGLQICENVLPGHKADDTREGEGCVGHLRLVPPY